MFDAIDVIYYGTVNRGNGDVRRANGEQEQNAAEGSIHCRIPPHKLLKNNTVKPLLRSLYIEKHRARHDRMKLPIKRFARKAGSLRKFAQRLHLAKR